jgi:hypothetical protein
MTIESMLEQFRLALGSITHYKKERKCDNCGYEFKNLPITICPKCVNALRRKSLRQIRKIRNRYIKNPNLCPICRARTVNPGFTINAGYACLKCGYRGKR